MSDVQDLRVSDIMSRTPGCLDESLSLADAYAWLLGEGIRGAPVVDSAGKLTGVVSNSDLLTALAPVLDPQEEELDLSTLEELKKTTLGEFAVWNPVTCAEDLTIGEACKLMMRRQVRRLVVMKDEEVVGVLSAIDIVRAVAGQGHWSGRPES